MKGTTKGLNLNEFHQKTIEQICTCGKHHDPHSQIHIPHQEISSYQNQYVKHPINTWKKPPPEKAPDYKPYDYINSKYREDYPGHKPQMREKIVPRVKDQNRLVPFDSSSEYKNEFGPKKVTKQHPFIKDNQYNPDNQPFNGNTTYNAHYPKKVRNPHQKPQNTDVTFPNGYKFDPSTTYNKDYIQKQPHPNKSYKPIQVVGDKGPHDLNTIYRQDFTQKPSNICPILKMPSYPKTIEYPNQYITYNKNSGNWIAK